MKNRRYEREEKDIFRIEIDLFSFPLSIFPSSLCFYNFPSLFLEERRRKREGGKSEKKKKKVVG